MELVVEEIGNSMRDKIWMGTWDEKIKKVFAGVPAIEVPVFLAVQGQVNDGIPFRAIRAEARSMFTENVTPKGVYTNVYGKS